MCISSYNSTGFSIAVQDYLETLLTFTDILCLQEHFLLDSKDRKHSNTSKIRNRYSDSYDMFIEPAVKSSTQVTKGRGSGGLLTLWNKSLTKYVSKVDCPNYRLQATKFSLPGAPILIFNSYFPCDPRTENFDETEVINLLQDIKSVARKSSCSNIILLGDLNCHFPRNNRFTNLVRDFLEGELGLTIMWEHPEAGHLNNIQQINYTHLSTVRNIPAYSILDHFVVSPQFYQVITSAGVIHSGSNPSNHSPIYLKLSVGELDHELESIPSESKISWDKATMDARLQYKNVLGSKLDSISCSPSCVECTDFHCRTHTEDMEEYTMQVLEAIELAGKECLPSVGKPSFVGRRDPIPGWSEHVKPYKDESLFWFSIWLSSGKPDHGETYQNMRHSKSQYKFAVRRLQRAQNRIQNDKFVSSILRGGVNIFEEIRKFRKGKSTISSRIDEEVGGDNIANHFAGIYSKLYNKMEEDEKLDNILAGLEAKIGTDSVSQISRVDENLIQNALNRMKANKRDAIFDTISDCYTHGPPQLLSHLALLVRIFLQHGSVPKFILLCTLTPLVKCSLGDITSSDNYRAIAGGCLLLKLIDIVILLLEGEKLNVDELQFGYQAKCSTIMCTWTVSAVIDYYNRNGSTVFGCAMDMSKAFDMVEWGELFSTLRTKGVHAIFLRLLLFIYRNQQCNVKWAGKYSQLFRVSNGVRQGAVSSAILFSVYIDELFRLLRRSRLGCHISGVYLGCFGYADDLFLLSSSRTGLQAMVDTCHEFASSKNLHFSTHENPGKSKTKCISFSKKYGAIDSTLPIKLDGVPLPWVSQVKHLGNMLQQDNSMRVDMCQKRGKFIGKMQSLFQEFSYVDPSVFMKVINLFNTSFYGSSLWDLFSSDCDKIFKSWNVTVRQAFGVHRCTHRYFIEAISESMHPKVMLLSRYVTFVNSLRKSSKLGVRLLTRLAEGDNRTVMGRTLSNLIRMCNLTSLEQLTSTKVKENVVYQSIPAEEQWRIGVAKELLQLRSNVLTLEGFTSDEVEKILDHICCT